MRPTGRPDDTTNSPAVYKSSRTRLELTKRLIIIEICIEVMANIEGGISSLQAQAIGLGRHSRIVVATEAFNIVDGMRPRVMQIHLQAAGQPAPEICLQAIIIGMTARTSQLYGTKSRVGPGATL